MGVEDQRLGPPPGDDPRRARPIRPYGGPSRRIWSAESPGQPKVAGVGRRCPREGERKVWAVRPFYRYGRLPCRSVPEHKAREHTAREHTARQHTARWTQGSSFPSRSPSERRGCRPHADGAVPSRPPVRRARATEMDAPGEPVAASRSRPSSPVVEVRPTIGPGASAPVSGQAECAEYAVGDPLLVGWWGGMSERERRRIRASRAA